METKGTVLARHLIQSFLPGETSPEMGHQISMKMNKQSMGLLGRASFNLKLTEL